MKSSRKLQFHMAKRSLACLLLVLLVVPMVFGGCKKDEKKPHATKPTQTEAEVPAKGMAVLTHVDTDLKKLSFQWVDSNEAVIFPYDGATWFYNKSKESISAAQLAPGDVIWVSYEKSSNVITQVSKATDEKLMENNRVSNFSVDETNQNFHIGNSLYQYDDQTLVFSEGTTIGIRELNPTMDTLHVWAYGTRIISIVVECGHGYLSLTGESLFVGGLITVGTILVRNIEDDMLLTVREGTYRVTVEHGKYTAEKEVTIERGKQEFLNLSDVMADVTETGNVRFNITPSDAELYIDGAKMNYSTILTLDSGKHNITVLSTQYETHSETVEITSGYQEITIDLTAQSETAEETSAATEETTANASETTASEETTTASEGVVSEKSKVTVDGPAGASVYFDSAYVGTAPVTFALVTGSHIITILEGTRIRSYTVNLAEGGDDVVFDFTEK